MPEQWFSNTVPIQNVVGQVRARSEPLIAGFAVRPAWEVALHSP